MKGNHMLMSAMALQQSASASQAQAQEPGLLDKLFDWVDGGAMLETGCAGLGAVSYPYCEFIGTWRASEAARQIQELLRAKGATSLKADGLWGPCTDSAFKNVFGEPLTKDSLQRLLGVTCEKFSKEVTGSCTNGSDKIFPVTVAVPIPGTASVVVAPAPAPAPAPDRSPAELLRATTHIAAPSQTPAPVPAVPTKTTSASSGGSGFPTWAAVAGIAVVAAAIYAARRA
jgi:hypothetical protein